MNMDLEKLETLALFAQAEHAKWQAAGMPWPRPTAALTDMIIAATPLNMLELVADVKRFRWLMRQDQFTAEQYVGYLCIDVVRSAIDAAMAQERGE